MSDWRTVERTLSARFGTPVRVMAVEDFPYSAVSRCVVEAANTSVPATVIVRALRSDGTRSNPARLRNEQAALQFLTSIGCTLAPRFIIGDNAAGIIITEDLGPHRSLLDLLLGNDRSAASAGLHAFARSLGRLHAQTSGHGSAFNEYLAQSCPARANAEHAGEHFSIGEDWRRVRQETARLELPEPSGADEDIETITHILGAPGSSLALSSGDPSPVNCKVAGGNVKFFDFEDACFRHPLLDAAVLRYPYPTGGPVWRLPPKLSDSIEREYRGAVSVACPTMFDDAECESGMAAACAAWTIRRMTRLGKVEAGPDRDSWPLLPPGWSAPVPTRSRRRQLVDIIETCIASAQRAGTLAALAAWCESMVEALRSRWPESTEEIPLYPAFAGQDEPIHS